MLTVAASGFNLGIGGQPRAGANPAPVAPVAEFAADATSGSAPLNVAFLNLTTGFYSSVLWDFGDGNTSTVFNPSHAYVAEGAYTVSLDVSGAAGSDNETKISYIVVVSGGGNEYVTTGGSPYVTTGGVLYVTAG